MNNIERMERDEEGFCPWCDGTGTVCDVINCNESGRWVKIICTECDGTGITNQIELVNEIGIESVR